MNYLHTLSVTGFIKESTHSPFPNSCHPTSLIPFPLPTSPSPRTLETGTGAHIHDRLHRHRFRPPQLQEHSRRRRKDTAVLVHFPCASEGLWWGRDAAESNCPCGLRSEEWNGCNKAICNILTPCFSKSSQTNVKLYRKQKRGKSIPPRLGPHKSAWKSDLKGWPSMVWKC